MRKRRAIIFDDEPVITVLFNHFFLSLGYDVLSRKEPAVCVMQEKEPAACPEQHACADLVITDYGMPGMNGLELLAAQERIGCKIPRENKAVLSGAVDPSQIRAIRALGATFFSKPADLDAVEVWVRGCEQRVRLSLPVDDRRKERRIPVPVTLPYQVRSDGQVLTCFALDISLNGCCLAVPVRLGREQTVRIAPQSSSFFREAEVRWISPQSNGSYLTGLTCR